MVEQIKIQGWTWMNSKVAGFAYPLVSWMNNPVACKKEGSVHVNNCGGAKLSSRGNCGIST